MRSYMIPISRFLSDRSILFLPVGFPACCDCFCCLCFVDLLCSIPSSLAPFLRLCLPRLLTFSSFLLMLPFYTSFLYFYLACYPVPRGRVPSAILPSIAPSICTSTVVASVLCIYIFLHIGTSRFVVVDHINVFVPLSACPEQLPYICFLLCALAPPIYTAN